MVKSVYTCLLYYRFLLFQTLQLTQLSDETQTVLVDFAERRRVFETPAKPRSFSRSQEEVIESPVPLNPRQQKGVLSRPMPTPEPDSDRSNLFRLIIQNGLTKDQTEDFLSFRQFYYSIWGNIVQIFRQLEKLAKNYVIPFVLINGEK